MSDRKINVHDAQVKTARVEIRHIVVSNRKMTQSVFRQIPFERVVEFDESGAVQFRGELWGEVNYWWKGTSPKYYSVGRYPDREQYQRRHMLWQLGDELRRVALARHWWECSPKLPLGGVDELHREGDYLERDYDLFVRVRPLVERIAAIDEAIAAIGEPQSEDTWEKRRPLHKERSTTIDRMSAAGLRLDHYVSGEKIVEAFEPYKKWASVTEEEASRIFDRKRAPLITRTNNWVSAWEDTVVAAPQLFIAV